MPNTKQKKRSSRLYVEMTPLGRGVFASKRFLRRDVIGRVSGRVIRDPYYESDYCIDLGEGTVLEPTDPWRYLNHSCHPNCELITWEGERSHRLWLMAKRAITPGEELTIDYAWPAEVAIPCRCGSPKCRGWIVDAKQLSSIRRRNPR